MVVFDVPDELTSYPETNLPNDAVCRYCKKTGLGWKVVNGYWALFEDKQLHECEVNWIPWSCLN